MSKKLAEGSNALVLDVKCGRGAFMKRPSDARALARSLVTIGTAAGVRTEAFITRMDAPLGRAVGNALEIAECIEVLQRQRPGGSRRRSSSRLAAPHGAARRARRRATRRPRRRCATALASGAALDEAARDDRVAGRRRRASSTTPAGCRAAHVAPSSRRRAPAIVHGARCAAGRPRRGGARRRPRQEGRRGRPRPPASCCSRSRATRSRPASRCWNCATTTARGCRTRVALAKQAIVIDDQAPPGRGRSCSGWVHDSGETMFVAGM